MILFVPRVSRVAVRADTIMVSISFMVEARNGATCPEATPWRVKLRLGSYTISPFFLGENKLYLIWEKVWFVLPSEARLTCRGLMAEGNLPLICLQHCRIIREYIFR